MESFSDGVFAVAITLLVLDLSVPSGGRSLIGALADEWPEFAAFAISFVVIGVIWVNHHAVLTTLPRADRTVLFANLALLMSIVVIPFATAMFARYATEGGDASHTAGALFAGAQLFMAITFSTLYVLVMRRSHADVDAADPVGRLRSTLRFGLGGFAYAVCIPLAFVNAVLVLAVCGGVAVYYVLDQVTVRPA
jgi:uncharacterized membrane protein